jgi:hypothetical protein
VRGEPIAEARTTGLSAVFSGGTPGRVSVYEDYVEVYGVLGLGTESEQRVRYDQIAQVAARQGWRYAEVTVETRGGAALRASGVPKRDALAVRDAIEERLKAH